MMMEMEMETKMEAELWSYACDAATTIRTATNMHSGARPVENMKNVKQKSGRNFSNLKLPTHKKKANAKNKIKYSKETQKNAI